MALLSASKLALSYGGVEVFSGINLEVPDQARIGIIGPNGSGKSSLLSIIVGELDPDDGDIYRSGGVRIGYVPQLPTLATTGTLRDVILAAFDGIKALERDIEASLEKVATASPEHLAEAEAAYATLLDQYERAGGYSYQNRLEQIAGGIGLSEESLALATVSASGGERTRAALARSLLSDPDLLVLDEPTNYLDLEGLTWLEKFLSHYPKAFLVVSHDRYFLDQVVNQVWELDHERLQAFPGNYSKYRALKAEQTLWQRRRYQRQQEYIAREESFIRRYGAGQRAREAKGRARRLDRLERVAAPETDQQVSLPQHSVGRTGLFTLRTENLKVGFNAGGEACQLFTVPDLRLERGSRTAILGNNGAGKTTLLKTLLGLTPALAGAVVLGHRVQVGYFRQELESLPEATTVFEALLEARDIPLEEVRPYLARFLFRGDEAFQEVSSLSGGQRSRLALARLLINEPNFLILDEPSTHLDIATREALEQVLLDFPGTLLLVSHDRHLVSLMAQQLWVVSDGTLQVFPGTFAEWEQKKQQEAVPPPRQKRPAPPRRNPTPPKRTPPKAPQIDLESVITELEARLKEIELQLQTASEKQDLAEIALLGEEHTRVTSQLEATWTEWTASATPQPPE